MLNKIGFLISSAVLFFSCGNNSSSEQKHEVVKKDTVVVAINECSKFLAEAKRLDNILLKATVVNPEIADQAIKAFYDFSTNCKTDTLAPVFLVKEQTNIWFPFLLVNISSIPLTAPTFTKNKSLNSFFKSN